MTIPAVLIALSLTPLMAAQPASAPPPEMKQFDFWVGEWECTGKSRNAPGKDEWSETKCTNSIKRILDSAVIEENFETTGFSGRSWTVYDKNAKVWKQTWVDNSGAYLAFTGGMEKGVLTLNQVMNPKAPKGTKMRMQFTQVKPESFVWNWESSKDSGKTWELMWQLNYKRKS